MKHLIKIIILLVLVIATPYRTVADTIKVLFICSDSGSNSIDSRWSNFLRDFQIECELVSKELLIEANFVDKDLIIVGPNTAEKPKNPNIKWFDYWGDQNKVNMIANSDLPILGISFGGMCLFGQMNLPLGGGHFAHGKATDFIITNSGWNYLKTSNNISVQTRNYLRISSKLQGYDGYYRPSANIEGIVQVADSKNYYPIVRYNNYIVWGCGSNPGYLTKEGKDLFVNLICALTQTNHSIASDTDNLDHNIPPPPTKSYRPGVATEFFSKFDVNVVIGYSGSFWNPIIRYPFKKETFGTQMGYFEVWYDHTLIEWGEKLKLFKKPYLNLQTDFGIRTSSDLISQAEQSSVMSAGNLILLFKVNCIDPLYFRYRKEIFVGQLYCDNDFKFFPFKGEPSTIAVGNNLLLSTEFHDYALGISFIKESPFYWRGFYRIEVGAYRSTWQRPVSSKIIYIDAQTGNLLYSEYSLYHAVNDFYGIDFGLYYFKDIYNEGEFFRSFDYGIGLRSGGFGLSKTQLTSSQDVDIFAENNKNSSCSELEFTFNGRLYWKLSSYWNFGLNFDYTFKKVFVGKTDENDLLNTENNKGSTGFISEDNVFQITFILMFAP